MLEQFIDIFQKLINESGIYNMDWRNLVMILISFVLIYLAVAKGFEPLLLLPIAFGMFLSNLPLGGVFDNPVTTMRMLDIAIPLNPIAGELDKLLLVAQEMLHKGETVQQMIGANGALEALYAVKSTGGGLIYYLYQGIQLGIYPPLIFLGVGAMTDFGPLIANPKSFLLGAAAQLGIFVALIGAMLLGFTPAEAGSIGIIGGADGPTAIYTTTILAPHLLPSIAVAAYSYMALVPIIQPPIMKLFTNDRERKIVMEQLRPVSKVEKVIFPVLVTLVVALMVPTATSLVGLLMFGNLLKESGATERLSKTAQNELMNIVTIVLGISVGATARAETFITFQTLGIIAMGLAAFGFGTAGGVLLGKLMCRITNYKINPLIGSAGVSAVPMAARVSQKVGSEYNPGNFLLMHAMGPNVAGVIGSAVAAGVLIAVLR